MCSSKLAGMTAVPDLHPDTGHPAAAAVREIHALLDTLLDDLLNDLDASAPLASGGYAALVADCDRAVTRLQALKLRLLAAAHRAEVALDAGMPGTSAWLARHTRTGGADAAREVRLATALDEDLPATATALDSGALSPAHAVVIAHTAARLPASLSIEDRVRGRGRPGRPGEAARPGPAPPGRAPGPGGRRARHRGGRRPRGRAAARGGERRPGTRSGSPCTTTATAPCRGHFTVPTLAGAILRQGAHTRLAPRVADAAPARPGRPPDTGL